MRDLRRYYRNECPIPGSRETVVFEHMGIRGLMPRKCSTCPHQEEGRCRLLTNGLKCLDFDFCGIDGETHLVEVVGCSYPLPAKCVRCKYLFQHPEYRQMIWCIKDKPSDCEVGRGLDYGDRDLAVHPPRT